MREKLEAELAIKPQGSQPSQRLQRLKP
jgi:hypothetical protein